jgi:CxxC motif-containing protein
MLTSTVLVKGGRLRLVPVRSSRPIAKGKMLKCMNVLASLRVQAPVRAGQRLVPDILRSGADIIATRSVPRA